MVKMIKLSDELYERLAARAEGFDTPASVIERILNKDEGIETEKPSGTYTPSIEFGKKDTTKYKFNNQLYGKGRLALAIVTEFVKQNPQVSFSELKNVFPKDVQGSAGVFDKIEDAQEIVNKSGRKRHYLNPGEPLKLADCTIAVSSQWGILNIDNIIAVANSLDFDITAINQ